MTFGWRGFMALCSIIKWLFFDPSHLLGM